jgi:hypothetical protein
MVVLTCASVGCGNSTGPSTANVAGTWSYQAPSLTNGQVTCVYGVTMTLTQTGTTFSGTYTNAYTACSGPAGASSTLVSGAVDSGTVSGSTITFGFANTDVTNSGEISEVTAHHDNTGTLAGHIMSGTATANVILGGVPYTLTGEWRAALR